MKKISALFCFCFILQMVNSQKLIVDDSVEFKRGIYKTYSEFKINSPSVPLEWDIQMRFIIYEGLAKLAYDDTVYLLKIDNIKTKEIGSIWGFCDGKDVYINREFSVFSGKTIFKPNSKFFKILFIGRYCFFVSAFPSGTNGALTHLAAAIDFNSGEPLEINKNRLEKIISKDKGLLQEYNNEGFWDKRADLIYYKYLKLYSEKHKDEIRRK